MTQKSLHFIYELQSRIYNYHTAGRATFVFAESLDDYCLTLGYASSIAAYDALPQEAKNYIHISKNKANPIFHMHAALAATPPAVLFSVSTDSVTNKDTIIPIIADLFSNHAINVLYATYC